MKNMDDVHFVIRAELDMWFKRQCENIYDDFYWYYLPTTAEHDGGLSVHKTPPANPDFILIERIRKDFTKEQNHRRIAELARRLPILEY
jgi:hypothetical protein